MSKPFTFETNNKNRLVREIRDGTLCLKAGSAARYRFAFYVGDQAVGIHSIQSESSDRLVLVRSWNASEHTFDPALGLAVPCAGRQFQHITGDKPLFLVEFLESGDVLDKIAFKARQVVVEDADIPCLLERLRFEAAHLSQIEILG